MTGIFTTIWHKWLRRPYELHVVADVGDPQGIPVVLLHGIASEGEVWRPLIKQIDTQRYRIIVLDLLGFGSSPQPRHVMYTVEDHTHAVVYTLQKRGLLTRRGAPKRRKMILVGHSMGCLVATHLAARYQRVVKRLILYEPPLYADDPAYRSHSKLAARYIAFYDYLSTHPELLMLQHKRLYRMAQRMSGIVLSEERWLSFERSLRNTIMRQTAFRELHGIRVPTDIVHGRLDFVVVRAEVKKMFEANPHITLHAVTASHGITQGAATYLNTIIQAAGQPHKPLSPRRTKKPQRRGILR